MERDDSFPQPLKNAAPEPQQSTKSSPSVETILEERGKRYGKFISHAKISQDLKRVLIAECNRCNTPLTDDQTEALSMICHKMARIVNGDPNYADSWDDIAGYATLVGDRLRGVAR